MSGPIAAPQQQPQVDMGRVVQRAAQNAAAAAGDLAAQLALTQEHLELQTARGVDLQRQVEELTAAATARDTQHTQALAAKDAELARLRATNEQLTQAQAAQAAQPTEVAAGVTE